MKKKKLDENTIRVLEVMRCGDCIYYTPDDCRIVKQEPPVCEETGRKIDFDQVPPDSCPLLTVTDFVNQNKSLIKRQEK